MGLILQNITVSGKIICTTEGAGIAAPPGPTVVVPVASFTKSTGAGDVPFDVTFTDTSTNTPTSWLWDFGDMATSTDQNPVHTYSVAGSYNVTLTATNSAGSNTSAAQVVVASVMVVAGGLWTCGYNLYGQLGDGTIANKSSPVQVGSLTNWKQVAGGYFHSAAVKTDGSLWTFGDNRHGHLGDGTTTNKSSPVQVGALTNWKQAAAGFWHTAAVKTDGSLWTFGLNNYGQLGDGTITNKSSPVQVGTLTNWKQVAGGLYHPAALR